MSAARGTAKQAIQAQTQQQPSSTSRKRTRSGSDAASAEGGSAGTPLDAKRAAKAPQAAEASSGYRGVTHHVRTNRYEAHIWEGGKQYYLGGWDAASQAALAFDIAAVRLRGEEATTNFHIAHYRPALPELQRFSPEQVIGGLRKMSRGAAAQQSSMFRGVTRHQKGRWEARIGAVSGRRYQYLGLHNTEVLAAMAYDQAAIAQKGLDAATNFHLSEYAELLSVEQLEEAVRRGVITAEDMQRRQLAGSADVAPLQPVAEAMAATAHTGNAGQDADMADAELAGAGAPSPCLSPAWGQLPVPSWVAAAEGSLAACSSPGSSSGGASPASLLLGQGAQAPAAATVGAAGASTEHLAQLLFDCILQEGADSPQSVLPASSTRCPAAHLQQAPAWQQKLLQAQAASCQGTPMAAPQAPATPLATSAAPAACAVTPAGGLPLLDGLCYGLHGCSSLAGADVPVHAATGALGPADDQLALPSFLDQLIS